MPHSDEQNRYSEKKFLQEGRASFIRKASLIIVTFVALVCIITLLAILFTNAK